MAKSKQRRQRRQAFDAWFQQQLDILYPQQERVYSKTKIYEHIKEQLPHMFMDHGTMFNTHVNNLIRSSFRNFGLEVIEDADTVVHLEDLAPEDRLHSVHIPDAKGAVQTLVKVVERETAAAEARGEKPILTAENIIAVIRKSA